MFFEEINPFVRKALVGNMDRGNTYEVHTKIKSADCRLFILVSGEGFLVVEGERYPIVPGTVVLFLPGTEYMWEIEKVKYYVVNFDYTHNFSHITDSIHPIHSELFDESVIVERPHFEDVKILNSPLVLYGVTSVANLVVDITTEFSMSGEYRNVLLSSLLKAAIVNIVRAAQGKRDLKENKFAGLVRGVISYINENYDRQLSNNEIAAKFHFNAAYLNRIFRKNTGSSIHEFLINCRIVAAKEILRSQNVSIGEVAERCGFLSLHHFTKTFKEKTHMTPSEYRNFNG